MVVELGFDVDVFLGRVLIKNKWWLKGVMVYVIDFILCMFVVFDF